LFFNVNFPKFDNRFIQPRKDSKTINKSNRQLKDYSEEFRFIVGQNDYITKEFFQLLHDFRTRKVNPKNLELDQLNNPQKLYNYLRNHHWSVNVPEEFLIDWISMKLTGHKLSDIDISDFNHIFNKLNISYDFLKNIENTINHTGAKMENIVRTRIYVTDINNWQEIGRAHGEVFKKIRPATTMVEVSRLIEPEILVEIEAIAVLDE